nr:hypothetical protein [uncultured Gellertiella sp.]
MVSPISTSYSPVVFLKGGNGNAATTNHEADNAAAMAVLDSIIRDFGENRDGGFSPPPMTVRSTVLSGGGVWAIGGAHTAIFGTSKDDTIQAGKHSFVAAGAGQDYIDVKGNSVAFGGDGNDSVRGSDFSVLSGDAGNDQIVASDHSLGFGDEGDDMVASINGSQGYGGAGNDSMSAWNGSLVDGGDGNDTLAVYGEGNQIIGGTGKDVIDLSQADGTNTVVFNSGDGEDSLDVGDFWHRSETGGQAPTTKIALGGKISAENTRIELNGKTAVLTFADNPTDRITVNFTGDNHLQLAFADGSTKQIDYTTKSGFQPPVSPAAQAVTAHYAAF